jgi:hypothetical protein
MGSGAWQDHAMGSRPRAQLDVAALVDSMFGEVFTAEERADLLAWIQSWETENPEVTAAERVTGWIDVAYAFQERGVSLPSWRPPRAAPQPAT